MALAVGCKGCSPEETARQVMTVQYLLGELKALLAGQDALLRRRLRIVNQQLQERERAEKEARYVHCDNDVSALQSELNDAHTSLQELQRDNTELRQALVDTHSQLQQSEAECSRIRKDVQSALADVQGCNSRLEECQKENTALALNIQKREQEIHTLQEHLRALQVPVAESPTVTDIPTSRLPLTKRALDQYQDQQGPSDHPVSQYLWSLEQKGCGSVSLPCKGPECNYTHQQDFSSHRRRLDMDMASPGKGQNSSLDSTGLSLCEVRSLASDWSAGSSSTFDTRDEQEFRNGLAALDASIASLQKTIKQDLKR
ncbi:coiled-coil domain-containing protein 14-like [Coregonus clupeaformis]|uniref:coiled-coil domain-containing protein 14-like n=1 Tax=Coregonus clupeaformis TaxID=59861 RepID=UPI001E1C9AAE|nr:coiled-coil domain-containing protein 14-like [Coregonus clupeaformis]